MTNGLRAVPSAGARNAVENLRLVASDPVAAAVAQVWERMRRDAAPIGRDVNWRVCSPRGATRTGGPAETYSTLLGSTRSSTPSIGPQPDSAKGDKFGDPGPMGDPGGWVGTTAPHR